MFSTVMLHAVIHGDGSAELGAGRPSDCRGPVEVRGCNGVQRIPSKTSTCWTRGSRSAGECDATVQIRPRDTVSSLARKLRAIAMNG